MSERPEHIARAFDALRAATPPNERAGVGARRPTMRDASERQRCQRCGGPLGTVDPRTASVALVVEVFAGDQRDRFDALVCAEPCATAFLVAVGDALAAPTIEQPELGPDAP